MSFNAQSEQRQNWSSMFDELQSELQRTIAKLSNLQSEVCRDMTKATPLSLPPASSAMGHGSSAAASADTEALTFGSEATEFATGPPSKSKKKFKKKGESRTTVATSVIGKQSESESSPRQGPAGPGSSASAADDNTDFLRASRKSSQATIPQTLMEDTLEECQTLMRSKIDANETFGATEVQFASAERGTVTLSLSSCNPLALAVLTHRPRLTKWLIEFKANLNSTYAITDSVEGRVVTYPCSHATVASGNLRALQQLLASRADIRGHSSNGASLLWQAARYNQEEILEYLLSHDGLEFHGEKLEERAMSRHNQQRAYTALHVAAKSGYQGVVLTLIGAKAQADVFDDASQVNVDVASADLDLRTLVDVATLVDTAKQKMLDDDSTERPNNPRRLLSHLIRDDHHSALQDAILGSHHEVARLLIQHGDTSLCLVNNGLVAIRAGPRILDLAFHSGNQDLIAAVAQGLKSNQFLLDQLTRNDLIQFLSIDGQAPINILKAIFQPEELRFWELVDYDGDGLGDRGARATRQTAYLWSDLPINVSVGPSPAELEKLFKNREQLNPALQAFVSLLAPQERTLNLFQRIMPGELFRAPVKFITSCFPGVHKDLDVLVAIADSPCDALFLERTCQAIIKSAAIKVRVGIKVQFVIAAAEVFNLVCVNYFLNHPEMVKSSAFCILCAFTLSGIHIGYFMLKALGFWCQGLLHRFLSEWFYVSSVVATFCLLFYITETNVDPKKSPIFCSNLGAIIFQKWVLMLFELCQFRLIGMHILPIMATMKDIWPFFLVLSMCTGAVFNLYYAFGLHSLEDSFLLIYRLAVLGDFNLNELDVRFATTGDKDYYFVVRLLLVLVSFVLTVSLMNLFVGVLSFHFEKRTEQAHTAYLRYYACCVLEAQALRKGLQAFGKLACIKEKEKFDRMGRSSMRLNGHKENRQIKQSRTAKLALADEALSHREFLWLCMHKD